MPTYLELVNGTKSCYQFRTSDRTSKNPNLINIKSDRRITDY
ncbi:hypothetical protein [Nostoc sp. DSM 114161]